MWSRASWCAAPAPAWRRPDPVEFPFDTCVIQIEAFGQAGQHVLARFGVHYGKFQGRATAVKRINTNLLSVLHLPVLRLYADSVVSSSDGWDSSAGALWSQEAPNFSNPIFQMPTGRRPFVWARASNQRFATGAYSVGAQSTNRDSRPRLPPGAGQQRLVNLDDQLLDRDLGSSGVQRGRCSSPWPEDGEVAGLQRQITGLSSSTNQRSG